ncbi:EFR1 family ferrodoxin [Desulfovibrio inopinatus]|uniref:EFR1 family ferrodoxin n=1 Tax=Desulfovibrio inopinatus TaxID=102109 RepID=UPI00041B4315|nr:EFR1 family ferrodoxin [Desulfovibrio inopinatus]
MRIAIMFFSATNNTRTLAAVIKKELEKLGAEVDLHDVTAPNTRERYWDLSIYQAVIFGFPVHSLRAPRIMRDWLETLKGNGIKCSMFFTYGGFMVFPAHGSTAEILTRKNFTLVSSAQFPGKHTYNYGGWDAFPNRPDKREFELAKKYTELTYKRFTGEDQQILSHLDKGDFTDNQLDSFEKLRFKIVHTLPRRKENGCQLCELCEHSCPTGAFDATLGRAHPDLCIACLRCVSICPDNAITINSTKESWSMKLSMSKLSEAELNNQMGKIYV